MDFDEKYEDIINTEWTGAWGRPKMPLGQRAKIFLPFAALKGYEEALEEKRILSVKSSETSYSAEDF